MDIRERLIKPHLFTYIDVYDQAWHSGIGQVIETKYGNMHTYNIDSFLKVKQSFIENYLQFQINASHLLYIEHTLQILYAERTRKFLVAVNFGSLNLRFWSTEALFNDILNGIQPCLNDETLLNIVQITLFFENQGGDFIAQFRELSVLTEEQLPVYRGLLFFFFNPL